MRYDDHLQVAEIEARGQEDRTTEQEFATSLDQSGRSDRPARRWSADV